MKTLELELSLNIADDEKLAQSLHDLKHYLEDAGIAVELLTEPPVAEELGGKAVAVLLTVSLLNESMHSALDEVHHWQMQHQNTPVVLHLTGKRDNDEPIQQHIQRENYHIELRKPKTPSKPKESAGTSPKP